MRHRQQVELDSKKRASRLQAMEDLDAKVEAYNATLQMRCHFAVKNFKNGGSF
jgi:hypothetical protein